ncbi:MAG: ribosome silencing factor [Bacilli bacterium]|jgi:ribosome-associated protein
MEKLKKIIDTINKTNIKNIKVYETSSITPFYDYAIIATATSSRQLKATVEHIKKESAKENYTIRSVEGVSGGTWVLIDLNDILINVFLSDEREKYALDKMWSDLPQVKVEEDE